MPPPPLSSFGPAVLCASCPRTHRAMAQSTPSLRRWHSSSCLAPPSSPSAWLPGCQRVHHSRNAPAAHPPLPTVLIARPLRSPSSAAFCVIV